MSLFFSHFLYFSLVLTESLIQTMSIAVIRSVDYTCYMLCVS